MESEHEVNTRIKLGSMILTVIIKDRRKLKTIKLAPIKITLVRFFFKSCIEPTLHEVIFFDFDLRWFFFITQPFFYIDASWMKSASLWRIY